MIKKLSSFFILSLLSFTINADTLYNSYFTLFCNDLKSIKYVIGSGLIMESRKFDAMKKQNKCKVLVEPFILTLNETKGFISDVTLDNLVSGYITADKINLLDNITLNELEDKLIKTSNKEFLYYRKLICYKKTTETDKGNSLCLN
jgi:hypothetical protein